MKLSAHDARIVFFPHGRCYSVRNKDRTRFTRPQKRLALRGKKSSAALSGVFCAWRAIATRRNLKEEPRSPKDNPQP